MKKQNIYFLISLFFVFSLGFFTIIKEETKISKSENRKLQRFEHFTLDSYIKGEYQDKLENALSDQFIGSENIRIKLKSNLQFFNNDNVPNFFCKNRYIQVIDDYYNFNCDDALIVKFIEYNKKDIQNIKDRIEVYNKLNDYVDTFYYFLPTANIYNFQTNSYKVDILKILNKSLEGKYKILSLNFENYDEYRNYFYKTDHHWNHKGSYEAYKNIISILKPNDKILEPVKEVVFNNLIFYGSRARGSRFFDYKENFTVYEFNFPHMEIINNGLVQNYGNESAYLKGIYENDKFANHYAAYYGGDSAEVIFETNKGNDNILILGSSYTNAIDKLIASHFNKTYDIDLRHYKKIFGEEFNIKKYIDKNNISKVIIIADYGFLIDDSFDIEWRE